MRMRVSVYGEKTKVFLYEKLIKIFAVIFNSNERRRFALIKELTMNTI